MTRHSSWTSCCCQAGGREGGGGRGREGEGGREGGREGEREGGRGMRGGREKGMKVQISPTSHTRTHSPLTFTAVPTKTLRNVSCLNGSLIRGLQVHKEPLQLVGNALCTLVSVAAGKPPVVQGIAELRSHEECLQ